MTCLYILGVCAGVVWCFSWVYAWWYYVENDGHEGDVAWLPFAFLFDAIAMSPGAWLIYVCLKCLIGG